MRLTDAAPLRDHWYVVAEASDVGVSPVPVTLLGARFVLWRGPDGGVVAAADRCPHREAPLSAGRVVDGCLECPYHGWTFGAGGRCVRVPSAASGVPVPPAAHLRALPVTERFGLVWLSPGTPARDVCRLACDDDPAYRRINTGVERWSVSATRMVDNFLDVSHFPYVHVGTFGPDQPTESPAVELIDLDADFVGYRYEVDVADEHGRPVHREMSTGFHLPFTVRSTIRTGVGADALDHVLLLCSTPIDDESSLFTFVVWRDDVRPGRPPAPPPDDVVAFDRAIGAEDRRMLERIPGALPLDLRATVSVQADRASVEWRRRLAALVGAG